MIKNFEKNVSITQGRLLPVIKKKIQYFPDKDWNKELSILSRHDFKYLDWIVSSDNFNKNPITYQNGSRLIYHQLKKNDFKVKVRSIDLDFIINEKFFNKTNNDMDLIKKKNRCNY